jgi:hypothetical protein
MRRRPRCLFWTSLLHPNSCSVTSPRRSDSTHNSDKENQAAPSRKPYSSCPPLNDPQSRMTTTKTPHASRIFSPREVGASAELPRSANTADTCVDHYTSTYGSGNFTMAKVSHAKRKVPKPTKLPNETTTKTRKTNWLIPKLKRKYASIVVDDEADALSGQFKTPDTSSANNTTPTPPNRKETTS